MARQELLVVFLLISAASACRTQADPSNTQPATAHEVRAPDAPPESRPLSVASWNLEWLNAKSGEGPTPRTDADYERLRHYATLLDADIIALQEVDGERAASRVFSRHEYAFHFASTGRAQRSGFAYRKRLSVSPNKDFEELSLSGTLRGGADVTLQLGSARLRLLGVHLKAGCFEAPLGSNAMSCQKLNRQSELIDLWVDQREADGEPFIVLGDFNRRLSAEDAFFRLLDDLEPNGAELSLVTGGRSSRCWGGRFPEFIDHFLLGEKSSRWWQPGSFEQLQFEPEDADQIGDEYVLSDHCPIRITLWPGGSQSSSGQSQKLGIPESPAPLRRVKGNISSGGRLYHLPECPGYSSTRIDQAQGERWFASEEEARAAGWKRAANCSAPNE